MPRSGEAARARLRETALLLFAERGFDRVTTAQISAAAAVNERTFFRHFADKREILFDGQSELRAALTLGVAAAPADAPPVDAVEWAVLRSTSIPESRRSTAHTRWAIISGSAALRERDAAKASEMAAALSSALVARGVEVLTAELAARAGWAAFHQAMTLWIADRTADADLASYVNAAFDRLRSIGRARSEPAGAAAHQATSRPR